MVSNKGVMQRHVNMVHLNLKLFQCEACPKALKCARSLRRHLVTKHGYVLDEKEMNQIEKDIERQQIIKPVETKCLKCDSNQFKDEFEFDNHVVICYGKTLNTSVEFKGPFIYHVITISGIPRLISVRSWNFKDGGS